MLVSDGNLLHAIDTLKRAGIGDVIVASVIQDIHSWAILAETRRQKALLTENPPTFPSISTICKELIPADGNRYDRVGLAACVEYAVCGHFIDSVIIEAVSINDLIYKINAKTVEWQKILTAADEKDGDLRQYAPEFGNGYPGLDGIEAEFGSDEFGGSIIYIANNGTDIDYNDPDCVMIRNKTGMA